MLAIVGLGMLHFTSEQVKPKEPALSQIDSSWAGEPVLVEGEVSSKYFSGGTLFVDLGDQNLTAVQFDTKDRFTEGDEVAVEGTVRIYQGEVEIVADSIE